jgi:hypothetical protein
MFDSTLSARVARKSFKVFRKMIERPVFSDFAGAEKVLSAFWEEWSIEERQIVLAQFEQVVGSEFGDEDDFVALAGIFAVAEREDLIAEIKSDFRDWVTDFLSALEDQTDLDQVYSRLTSIEDALNELSIQNDWVYEMDTLRERGYGYSDDDQQVEWQKYRTGADEEAAESDVEDLFATL